MDLVNRLRHYMETSLLTISQFADRCGIPRPTMSQLMNGRNKRISDEIINKIHSAYPDLSVLWLMFGEGDMLTGENIKISEPQKSSIQSVTQPQHTDFKQDNPQATHNNPFIQNDQSGGDTLETLLFDEQKEIISTSQTPLIDDPVHKDNILFETTPKPTPTSTSSPVNSSIRNDFGVSPAATPRNANVTSNDITRTLSGQVSGQISGQTQSRESRPNEGKSIQISADAHKKITNIVVFYSDNSFQSFLPDV